MHLAADVAHPKRMAEQANLLLVGELGEAIELVGYEQVSARAPQKQVERGVEVQQGYQRDEIGDSLVVREVFVWRLAHRQAHDAEHDQMPDLVRDRVEVQGERLRLPTRIVLAHLQKTVAGLGIVPVKPRHDLQPVVGRREEPRDLAPEIALANVEDASDAGKEMRRFEFRRPDRDRVEMAVRSGLGRWPQSAHVGRQIGKLVRLLVEQWVDHIHPVIGRSRCNPGRRGGDPDRLRPLIARDERRLGENEKAGPKPRNRAART